MLSTMLDVVASTPKSTFKYPQKQIFPFHANLINYILQNQSPSVYFKLLKTCKYFFSKYPILPIDKLRLNGNSSLWKATIGQHEESLKSSNIQTPKLWIGKSLESFTGLLYLPTTGLENLIPRIGRYEVASLTLSNQTIKYSTFKFLISSPKLKHVDMKQMFIEDPKNEADAITLDKLISELPKLDSFIFFFTIFFTKNIAFPACGFEFNKALKSSDIKYLKLCNIESGLNFETFYEFLISQDKMQIVLCFTHLERDYQQQLQNFVNHLIESGITLSPKPFISFPGQQQRTANALDELPSI